jgi:hypothetical protein
MVPKVTSAGRSFKGAARYYLHDKQADTSERVAFVETVNLPTNDPRRAVAHMVDTASHADQLKQAAGIKGGRKLDKPVYTYALTWHPSETPTKAEQLEAARESLKVLGMADRQAIIIAHDDAAHPHVHVMVNRVCPETGRAASNSNDRLKLSEWAQAYEQERGQVFCDKRVENNAARQQGAWRKDNSDNRQVWLAWKKAQTRDLWDEFRAETADLKDARKGQYQALWEQKENRFSTRRAEVKSLYKPEWRGLYKRQEEQLRDHDSSIAARLRHARRLDGRAVKNMFRALVNDESLRQELIKFHKGEIADLSNRQKQAIRDAGREVTKAYKYDRDALRTSHRLEDERRYQQAKDMSQAIWEQPEGAKKDFQNNSDRRSRENKPARRSLEALYGDDENALKAARNEQAKQQKKAKERKRTRPRSKDRGGRTM